MHREWDLHKKKWDTKRQQCSKGASEVVLIQANRDNGHKCDSWRKFVRESRFMKQLLRSFILNKKMRYYSITYGCFICVGLVHYSFRARTFYCSYYLWKFSCVLHKWTNELLHIKQRINLFDEHWVPVINLAENTQK